jgi:hypothetical protein
MVDFLTGAYLVWIPKIFFWAVFGAAAYAYWNRPPAAPEAVPPAGGKAPDYLRKFSRRLIKAGIVFYVLYAAFLTWGQYYVWSQNPLGRILLVSDRFGVLDGSSGYFIFYSYLRFWLNPALAVLAAFLFYVFLKSLKKYRERFFEEGETEVGFLAALAAGWPGIVVFIPLAFLVVVLVSGFRLAVFRERFTTLGWPLLISLLLVLAWGDILIKALGLKVLYI